MSKKIIEHNNQSFMFDGEYTQPIRQEVIIEDIKVKDITFDIVHLVAECLVSRDRKIAIALVQELELQI